MCVHNSVSQRMSLSELEERVIRKLTHPRTHHLNDKLVSVLIYDEAKPKEQASGAARVVTVGMFT